MDKLMNVHVAFVRNKMGNLLEAMGWGGGVKERQLS